MTVTNNSGIKQAEYHELRQVPSLVGMLCILWFFPPIVTIIVVILLCVLPIGTEMFGRTFSFK